VPVLRNAGSALSTYTARNKMATHCAAAVRRFCIDSGTHRKTPVRASVKIYFAM
jgi:hypothetical protein